MISRRDAEPAEHGKRRGELVPSAVDVLRPSEVRQLLADSDFRPRKALGQNFLVDRNIRDLIVHAAAVGKADAVLEIGPGLGALTEALIAQAGRVTAVEKDEQLFHFLKARFGSAPNVSIVHADMLDVDVALLAPARVVSNLPYSVGSRILVNLARMEEAPAVIVVTVQKEVADRLAAAPATSNYGMLSLWMQARYEAEIVHVVGPRCFFPEPEVRSAVVRLVRRAGDVRPLDAFYALTRAAFAQRRKQVARSLTGAGCDTARVRAALEAVGLAPTARPEELSAGQWREVVGMLVTSSPTR